HLYTLLCILFLLIAFSSLLLFITTSTSAFYTLSLHDALPISVVFRLFVALKCFLRRQEVRTGTECIHSRTQTGDVAANSNGNPRSEEHTSELQSRVDLVCRLLLEKKKKSKT